MSPNNCHGTQRHDLHALSTFFVYAIKKQWARENPVRSITIPSDAEAVRIHVITADEEKHYFLRAAKNQDLNDFAQLMLNQGMRPDEVLGLGREDIDLERGQLFIRNGKSPAARRTLDPTTESRRILSTRMEGDSPWIFPSKRKPGMRLRRLNGAHDRLCAKAVEEGISLKFVLYDFRHTFATRLAQAGIDLATLAAILGHNSIRIVHRYVHPTADHKRDAMMRYDENSQSWPGSKPGSRRQTQLTIKILGTFCPPLRSKTTHLPLLRPIERAGRNRGQLHPDQQTTRKE
jgi:integrase